MKIKLNNGYLVDKEEMSMSDYFKSEEGRAEAKEFFSRLEPNQIQALKYSFAFNARPKQKAPPGDWKIWVIHAGRGFGKTYAGASWVKQQVELAEKEGRSKNFKIGIAGNNDDHVCNVQVQAIIDLYSPDQIPIIKNKKLVWNNGAIGILISEKSKYISSNMDIVWVDDMIKFTHADKFWKKITEQHKSKILITTVPQKDSLTNNVLKDIKFEKYGKAIFINGSIYENSNNLASDWSDQMYLQYKGSSLEDQELNGIIF
jgi:phage terminase large subunit-like protein